MPSCGRRSSQALRRRNAPVYEFGPRLASRAHIGADAPSAPSRCGKGCGKRGQQVRSWLQPFVLDGVLYHESDLDLEENGARLEGHMATLDTHAIARTLTDAGADPKLADAITAAVREAADHGDHVTPDQFKAGLAEMEARLTWRFAGAMLAQTGVILAAVIGAAVAILRMLG